MLNPGLLFTPRSVPPLDSVLKDILAQFERRADVFARGRSTAPFALPQAAVIGHAQDHTAPRLHRRSALSFVSGWQGSKKVRVGQQRMTRLDIVQFRAKRAGQVVERRVRP